jgi:hypothetical protein
MRYRADVELMDQFSGANVSLENSIILLSQKRVAWLACHDSVGRMFHGQVSRNVSLSGLFITRGMV